MTAIISDNHANYPALKAVIDDIQRRGKKIISLGDVCGYHSMINECIELLLENNVINIRGNHDNSMIENEQCERSISVNKSLDFQRQVINDENFELLKRSIPFYRDSMNYMVHGSFSEMEWTIIYIRSTMICLQHLKKNIFLPGIRMFRLFSV